MKQFNIPAFYRSELINNIKKQRKESDKLKKDFSPTLLDFGSIRIFLARHFGFCYGVENAIEIAYRCVEDNPGKRIFLLSEMIHNPQVNAQLHELGVEFLQDAYGKTLIPFDTLSGEDVVIIPAFGTTVSIEEMLNNMGIATQQYNTTCPFVEKVWNRGEQLGEKGFSLVIHGKPAHEETRATFSRVSQHSPAVIVANMEETIELGKFISGEKEPSLFYETFKGRFSRGFDIEKDLQRFGVINQTTQLATDTQAIADYLKSLVELQNQPNVSAPKQFADTRDTLCYATNDNQTSVREMLTTQADLAIVVGGYNSSNTSHLVELCEEQLPTYYIRDTANIIDEQQIVHFDWRRKTELTTSSWLPTHRPVNILITSGASCPDALVQRVMEKLLTYFPDSKNMEQVGFAFKTS